MAGGTRRHRYRCYLSVLAGFTTLPLPPALPTNYQYFHRLSCRAVGGENGIRTRGTLLEYTRFPGEYHKPLGHLSVIIAFMRFERQQARRNGFYATNCLKSNGDFGGERGIRTPGTLQYT